ncbi:MAG: response regulator [Coprococcus sp.]
MDQRSKLNIAVCDDDIFVTEQLSEWIKEYFVSNHLEEPNIYEFDNGENLIKSEVKYDFVFLDIVIPGMNGINIGRRLLEQNEECLIYIITAYDSYLDAAMSLGCSGIFQSRLTNPVYTEIYRMDLRYTQHQILRY